jgi:hypothetical protein
MNIVSGKAPHGGGCLLHGKGTWLQIMYANCFSRKLSLASFFVGGDPDLVEHLSDVRFKIEGFQNLSLTFVCFS